MSSYINESVNQVSCEMITAWSQPGIDHTGDIECINEIHTSSSIKEDVWAEALLSYIKNRLWCPFIDSAFNRFSRSWQVTRWAPPKPEQASLAPQVIAK